VWTRSEDTGRELGDDTSTTPRTYYNTNKQFLRQSETTAQSSDTMIQFTSVHSPDSNLNPNAKPRFYPQMLP